MHWFLSGQPFIYCCEGEWKQRLIDTFFFFLFFFDFSPLTFMSRFENGVRGRERSVSITWYAKWKRGWWRLWSDVALLSTLFNIANPVDGCLRLNQPLASLHSTLAHSKLIPSRMKLASYFLTTLSTLSTPSKPMLVFGVQLIPLPLFPAAS